MPAPAAIKALLRKPNARRSAGGACSALLKHRSDRRETVSRSQRSDRRLAGSKVWDQRKLLPFRTGWIVSLAFFTDAALNGTLRKFGGAVFYGAERADCLCYAENGWEFGKWVAATGLS